MANGPKRQSNKNRIDNRKVAYAKAQKRNESNRNKNQLQAQANLKRLVSELGNPPAHIETRTHTRVQIDRKTKLPTVITYTTSHAERPSKALRRLKRAEAREIVAEDARNVEYGFISE